MKRFLYLPNVSRYLSEGKLKLRIRSLRKDTFFFASLAYSIFRPHEWTDFFF